MAQYIHFSLSESNIAQGLALERDFYNTKCQGKMFTKAENEHLR